MTLTIRTAAPVDADAVDRLAQLDSSRTPQGPVLVGEVAFLVAERARQMNRGQRGPGRLARAFASVTGHVRPRPAARLVH